MMQEKSDLATAYSKILRGLSTIERFIEKFGAQLSDEDYQALVYRLTVIEAKAKQVDRK